MRVIGEIRCTDAKAYLGRAVGARVAELVALRIERGDPAGRNRRQEVVAARRWRRRISVGGGGGVVGGGGGGGGGVGGGGGGGGGGGVALRRLLFDGRALLRFERRENVDDNRFLFFFDSFLFFSL